MDPLREIGAILAPLFAYNNMKEQEALEGYYRLRDTIDTLIDRFPVYKQMLITTKEQVEEKIADELNHATENHLSMIEYGRVKEATT